MQALTIGVVNQVGSSIARSTDAGADMETQSYDPGDQLQECPGTWAGKCPTECFLSAFGHLPRSAPKSAF